MVGKRSWEKAHSPYWSMHVEAWRQSGLSRAEYCRCHALSKRTFDKWMKHLSSEEDARRQPVRRFFSDAERPRLQAWFTTARSC